MQTSLKKGISVLVCSFNGADRLPQTIAHLARQVVQENVEWEIILVDNASTDNTSQVAKGEWKKHRVHHVDFSIVFEPRPGKINALETGTKHCKYEYFIICDDDNWLCDSYVQKTYELLEKDPRIGAVGGQAFPVSDTGVLPEWFDHYKEGYAVGQQAADKGDVTKRGFVFGAGLGTRTRLYQAAYEKFPSLLIGRQGYKLSAGEDAEYCQRLILRNYRLYYEPTLTFKHYLPTHRLQENYRDRLYAGLQDADQILETYYMINRFRRKVRHNFLNKARLLIIVPFRILFARSRNTVNNEMKLLMYLLDIQSKKDRNFDSIRKFEKTESF